MTVIRWTPSRDLLSTWNEFDRLFNRLYGGESPTDGQATDPSWNPALDMTEREDRYVLQLELPGISPDDVRITLDDNVLTIQGEKQRGGDSDQEDRAYRERRYGKFERSFYLNDDVDKDQIEAQYAQGVMTLTLPKTKKSVPRDIPVQFRK